MGIFGEIFKGGLREAKKRGEMEDGGRIGDVISRMKVWGERTQNRGTEGRLWLATIHCHLHVEASQSWDIQIERKSKSNSAQNQLKKEVKHVSNMRTDTKKRGPT